jgi:hypothetical protein
VFKIEGLSESFKFQDLEIGAAAKLFLFFRYNIIIDNNLKMNFIKTQYKYPAQVKEMGV